MTACAHVSARRKSGGGDVGEECVDVAFDRVLALLVGGGALVGAVIVLVECGCLERAKGDIVVAAEYARFEASCGEESEDAFEVI